MACAFTRGAYGFPRSRGKCPSGQRGRAARRTARGGNVRQDKGGAGGRDGRREGVRRVNDALVHERRVNSLAWHAPRFRRLGPLWLRHFPRERGKAGTLASPPSGGKAEALTSLASGESGSLTSPGSGGIRNPCTPPSHSRFYRISFKSGARCIARFCVHWYDVCVSRNGRACFDSRAHETANDGLATSQA